MARRGCLGAACEALPARPPAAKWGARSQPPLRPHCSFSHGLGMTLVAKSDQSTGNHHCASYVLQVG